MDDRPFFVLPMAPGGAFVMRFDYVNHRGEAATRRVVPTAVLFSSTEWHPEPQWLLRAMDLDRGGQERMFAMRDMVNMRHGHTDPEPAVAEPQA